MQENARQGFSDTVVKNEGYSLKHEGLSSVDDSCHSEGFAAHCSGGQARRHVDVAVVVKECEDAVDDGDVRSTRVHVYRSNRNCLRDLPYTSLSSHEAKVRYGKVR